MTNSVSPRVDSSPVRAESRRSGLSWTEAESKIRKMLRASADELPKKDANDLYRLALCASRHAGESPRHLLQRAKRIAPVSEG